MFGKLKEKLKNWTKKVSEKKVEETLIKEEIEKKPAETAELPTPEKYPEPPFEEKIIKEETKKEIPLPVKFEPGTQKYETDLEKLEELTKEIEESTKKIKKLEKEKELAEKSKEIEKQEKEIEEEIPGKKGFFKKITSGIKKTTISEKDFEIYSEELKMLLLENNVAFEVAEKIITKLGEEIIGKEFLKKEIEGTIETTLKDIIIEILIEPFDIVDKIKQKEKKPFVILFCGINGTGKTTTIAKMAKQFQDKKLSCVIAAADTFRAASIEQIQKHADKLKIKLISHDYGTDPAAVGFDAIKYAEKNRIDIVLIDTAGRMHSEKNLLKELEKINKVCKPDLKIFVGEAITGNDSIEQVRSFNFSIGIDGIILTKADTDEKGGTALSVGYVTKKPILYLGTGQEYNDLTPFNKNKFIEELGL